MKKTALKDVGSNVLVACGCHNCCPRAVFSKNLVKLKDDYKGSTKRTSKLLLKKAFSL